MYKKQHKGFTLVELLVVCLIIGILAISLWIYQINMINKAKYSHSQMIMRSVAVDLKGYRELHNEYPPDVYGNIKPGIEPDIIESFPVIPGTITPYNQTFDYDNYIRSANGFTYNLVQIIDTGKNHVRDSNYELIQGRLGEFVRIGDDQIFVIALNRILTP